MEQLSDSEHLKNLLTILQTDNWDEEIAYEIRHYCRYFGLVDDGIPFNQDTVDRVLKEISNS